MGRGLSSPLGERIKVRGSTLVIHLDSAANATDARRKEFEE
jgi:hypothetical protein